MTKIGILGAGMWGTALAFLCTKNANQVLLWSRNNSLVENININNCNNVYFPNKKLSKKIKASSIINDFTKCKLLLIAVPSYCLRQLLCMIKQISCPIVLCNKGIERESLMFASQVVEDVCDKKSTAILSGPNFAKEIINGCVSAADLACTNDNDADFIINLLQSKYFFLYRNKDLIGTQVCGAIKNIIAIACGIAHGLDMGENFRAFLITIGLHEIKTICSFVGGKESTILGVSGIGDLLLTCNSSASRNFNYGFSLCKDKKLNNYMPEGFYSCKSLNDLSQKLNIKLSLCNFVYNVVYCNDDVKNITKIF